MKTRNLILSGAILLGALFISSCDKNDNVDTPTVETSLVEQNAALDDLEESIFDGLDVYLSTDNEVSAATQLKTTPEGYLSCVVVTFEHPEGTLYPLVVTFDFGTENCEDRFGQTKRGKIIVTKTGPYWLASSERTVTFENFYVNDNSITGTRRLKNEGKNGDGNWEFSMTVDVTFETTEGITWTKKADRTRTMIAGADTKNYPFDDEFLITGTSSGESSEGYSIQCEITTPIYRKRECRFPVSGVVEIVRTKGDASATVWLNYGSGECDYMATVTDEDGNVVDITLGGRFKKE